MPDHKHFKVQQNNGITTVELVDQRLFDTLIISELQDELIEFLEAEEPRNVLVDFGSVTYCTSSVINGVLRAKKRIIGTGGQLKLCNMNPQIREAYRVLNLDGTVFDIYDTVEEAIAAF